MKFQIQVAICVLTLCLLPHPGFSQSAWTPPKGTYSLAISYQNNFTDRHSLSDGRQYLTVLGKKIYDIGSTRTQAAYVDLGYALTDKLSAGIDVPYMSSKYYSPKTFPEKPDGTPALSFGPHYFWEPGEASPGQKLIDNGDYHGGFQDIGFRIRYNVATNPFMITPFIQYSAPSHSYQFYSHAVYGNRVSEFQIGTFLGGFVSDKIYLHGAYGLGFPQKIIGISRIHHHMEFESGYFVNEKIKLFGLLHAQVTNGGNELTQDPSSYYKLPVIFEGFGFPSQCAAGLSPCGYTSNDQVMLHHLQTQRDSFLNMSAGMEYSLNPSMSVFGVFEHTLTNRNLHILKYGLTFGVSWGFGGKAQRPCHC
ncbi:MAG: hypothetical protein C5B54_07770 [Acidobacteria bacterium]|nr:MAG: hypothetical protein C5B54_07770 [Acidobacteriota bacterium]